MENCNTFLSEHLRKLLCCLYADTLFGLSSVIEGNESGDAEYAEALCKLRLLVDIDLADLHVSAHLSVKLFENGCLHTAGTAPRRPKVDNDLALCDACVEVFLCKM